MGEKLRKVKYQLNKWLCKGINVLQDARGATTAEYALLLALVVIVLIATLRGLGNALDTKISEITSQISGAAGGN